MYIWVPSGKEGKRDSLQSSKARACTYGPLLARKVKRITFKGILGRAFLEELAHHREVSSSLTALGCLVKGHDLKLSCDHEAKSRELQKTPRLDIIIF